MSGIKPSFEPIIVARKPFDGSLVDNVVRWGVGGINIDECRVPFEDTPNPATNPLYRQQNGYKHDRSKSVAENSVVKFNTSASENPISPLGRFPANLILGYDETNFEEVCGGMPVGGKNGSITTPCVNTTGDSGIYSSFGKTHLTYDGYNDEGSAARYFKNIYFTDKDDDVNIRIIENETEVKGMRLYSEGKDYKLYQGNMLDMLEVIEPNSIDSIVTDPPYELNFMGKGWDNSGIAFKAETWNKCLQVLKPGGYLLAFGGSRTYHRIACAIEDAGFEIRDTIMWLYGSGFPKSMDIGLAIDKKNGVESELCGIKPGHEEFVGRPTNGDTNFADGMIGFDRPWMHDEEKREAYHYKKTPTSQSGKKWSGWGTALKPSFEPIIVARKPFKGSLVDNVIEYGVGGINIDECRVATEDELKHGGKLNAMTGDTRVGKSLGMFNGADNRFEQSPLGRFPANTILTYDDTDFEEVCGGFPETSSNGGTTTMPDLRDVGKKSKESIGIDKLSFGQVSNAERKESNYVAPMDSGSAARYFYNAKVSDKDEDVDRPTGRFPANTILTYDKTNRDEVCGGFPNTGKGNGKAPYSYAGREYNNKDTSMFNGDKPQAPSNYNDSGSASRYFYCAKASKKDRDEGLDSFEEIVDCDRNPEVYSADTAFNRSANARKNTHPTVKPTDLMQYLVRLVTPNGGTVLDPFNGSGSTGKAVMWENRERLKGYKYIGIELTPDYLPISRARIEYAADPNNVIVREEVDEETEEVTKVSYKEVSLF